MSPLIFGLPGGAEWIIIVIALLLIFGGSRVAGLGKGSGRAIREFKEELHAGEVTKSSTVVAEDAAEQAKAAAPADKI